MLLGLLLPNLLTVLVCASLPLFARRGESAGWQAESLHDVRLTEQVAGRMVDKATIALGAVGLQLDVPVPDLSSLWSIVDAQSVSHRTDQGQCNVRRSLACRSSSRYMRASLPTAMAEHLPRTR